MRSNRSRIALPFSVLIPFRNVRRIVLYTSVMECLQKTLEGRNIFVCSFTSKAMISKLIPSWNTPSLTPPCEQVHTPLTHSRFIHLYFLLGFRIFLQVLVKLLVEPSRVFHHLLIEEQDYFQGIERFFFPILSDIVRAIRYCDRSPRSARFPCPRTTRKVYAWRCQPLSLHHPYSHS